MTRDRYDRVLKVNEGQRLNSEHIFVSAISDQLSNCGIPAKCVLAVAKTNDKRHCKIRIRVVGMIVVAGMIVVLTSVRQSL